MSRLANTKQSKIIGICLVSLIAGFSSGCKCTPGEVTPMGITVTLDPSLRNSQGMYQSVPVSLVGVNSSEYQRFENKHVSEYWQPNDQMRRTAEGKEVILDAARQVFIVEPTDPIWKSWQAKAATHLFVIVLLPGNYDDKPGQEDIRRIILPLDKCAWPDTKMLDILIKSSGVISLNQPSPLR